MEILDDSNHEDLAEGPAGDRQQLQPALEAVSMWAQASGNRSTAFWEQQRAAILSRISVAELRSRSRASGFAWAIAAAVIVIASFILRSGPAPAPEMQMETDRQLLQQVESAMESGGPAALEPAALLADEIGQYQRKNSVLPNREETGDEE